MRMIDSLNDLPEEQFDLLLGQVVMLDVLVQFSPGGHLHDHEDIIGRVEYFVQFDDIGVADELEYLDLAFDLPKGGGTLGIIFLFFILRLLRILMATRTPVRSCLASD